MTMLALGILQESCDLGVSHKVFRVSKPIHQLEEITGLVLSQYFEHRKVVLGKKKQNKNMGKHPKWLGNSAV